MKFKYILPFIGIFIFYYFYKLAPVPFMQSGTWFWCFFGSIAAAVGIFVAFKPKSEMQYDINTYKEYNTIQGVLLVVCVLITIIGGIVSLLHQSTRKENFIKKNPVVVNGEVIDGVAKTKKNSTTYELTIKYEDKTGNRYTENIDVSSTEWNSVGKGMPVKVVYEKNNPSIAKLLISSADLQKYADNGSFKTLNLNTFFKIINSKNHTEMYGLLGEDWKIVQGSVSNDNGTRVYNNSFSHDNIAKTALNYIYINEKSTDTYYKVLAEARFSMKEIENNKENGITFENDSFKIRFMQYSSVDKSSKLGFMVNKINSIGFAKKGEVIILPNDMKEDKPESEKTVEEKLEDALDKKRKN